MDVFNFIYASALASTIGLLAARKHRNGWEWSFVSLFPILLFGTDLFWLLLLLVLLLRSACPKCDQLVSYRDARTQNCPHCHFHGRLGLLSVPLQDIIRTLLRLGKNKHRSHRRAKMRRGYSRP